MTHKLQLLIVTMFLLAAACNLQAADKEELAVFSKESNRLQKEELAVFSKESNQLQKEELAVFSKESNQLQKKELAALKKECKQTLKELKKDGWKTFDGEQLDAAVERHYQRQQEAGGQLKTIIGTAKSSSPNVAQRLAKANASQQFAAMKNTALHAETKQQAENVNTGVNTTTNVQIQHSVEATVEQRVKHLQPSMTLMRTLPNDDVEVIAYFFVDIPKGEE